MASYYVYSGAAGAANGTSWADAYTTMTTALASKAAGDIFYVADDHLEITSGAITLTSPGTLSTPCFFYCVLRSGGSVPPVAADLRTTGEIRTGAGNFAITLGGAWVVDGLIFTCSLGGGSATGFTVITTQNIASYFRNCTFKLGTSASGNIAFGAGQIGSYVELDNCTFSFAAVGQSLQISCPVVWKNTPSALQGAAVPTTLIFLVGRAGRIICKNVDLSAAGSGKTILDSTINTITGGAHCIFDRCKIDDDATKFDTPASPGNIRVDLVRCSESSVDGGRNQIIRGKYEGTLTTEYTIVMTSGATDGITPVAWKIVSTANCSWVRPFEAPPIVIWNDTDGSAVTVTLEGIWDGGAVPTNKDIWIDVEYPGDNTSPLGSTATGSVANNLATGTNLTASSETWGGSTTDFKLECTFTPQQKGPLSIFVKVGKASDTFYVDPKPVLS